MVENIYELSIRAVLGGLLVIAACLIALSLQRRNAAVRHGAFFVFTGVVALVSGILFATALYAIQNPSTTFEALSL